MSDELVIEDDDYEESTNDDLRDELADRDLPTSGNKDELVERLEEDDKSEENTVEEDETETTKDVGGADEDEIPGYAATVQPSNEPREDGLVGVGDDYPTPAHVASRDADDSDE